MISRTLITVVTAVCVLSIGCSVAEKEKEIERLRAQLAQQQHELDEARHQREREKRALRQIKLHVMDLGIEIPKIQGALRTSAYSEIAQHGKKAEDLATQIRDQAVELPENDMILYLSNEMKRVTETIVHEATERNHDDTHHALEELETLYTNLKDRVK